VRGANQWSADRRGEPFSPSCEPARDFTKMVKRLPILVGRVKPGP
jgi:hypothetical protein